MNQEQTPLANISREIDGKSPVTPAPAAWIRLTLLVLLPLLAGLNYWRGQQFDPDLLDFKAASSGNAALLPERINDWHRLGAIRRFTKANLYEYINGHAEYFLGAGFREVVVGEYGSAGNPQPSLVVDIYDLAAPLNAFGVLMDEMGETGQPAPVGEMGFRTGRSLGFLAGPYYVKLAAFADGMPLLEAGAAIRQTMGSSMAQAVLTFPFPDLGPVVVTRFIKENYRGWGFLPQVVERTFQGDDGQKLTAFLVTGTPQQQGEIREAFRRFFQQEGSEFTESTEHGLAMIQVADRYEGDWMLIALPEGWLGIFHPLDDALRQRLQQWIPHHG